MEDKEQTLLEKIGTGAILTVIVPILLVIFSPLMVLFSLYRGWALSVAWGWLAVPLFHVREITVLEFMVISFFVNSIIQHPTQPDDKGKWKKSLLEMILSPLGLLFFAWVLKILFVH